MDTFRRRVRLVVILGALSLVALRCIEGPLEPIAPTMNVELNLPLYDDTKTFADLVVDTLVRRNPDGTITYRSTQSLNPVGLDSLSLQPRSSGQQVSLGVFGVGTFTPAPIGLNAAAIGFPPAPYLVFPPTQITLAPLSADISSQIGFVAVHTGTLTLTVTNTLPIPIDFPTGITLRNNSVAPLDHSFIGVFSFAAPIGAGQQRTASVDLAGQLVRGNVQTDSIVLHTAGDPGSGTIASSNGLTFAFSSTALQADSAGAVIPSQSLLQYADSVMTIDDSVTVSTADFKSGQIAFAFVNNTDVKVKMYVKLNEVVSVVGAVPLTVDTTLQRRDSVIVPVSLAANRIVVAPSSMGTKATFSVGLNTITSDSVKATVTKSDFVRAELRAGTRIALKSATGKIKPMRVAVNTASRAGFNTGEFGKKFSAQLTFDSVKVTVRLGINGGFPMDYNLTLIAKNTAMGKVDSIVLPVTALGKRRVYPGIATPTVIVIDKASNLDAFLGKFFPSLPDSFFIRGSLLVEPPEEFALANTYFVADTSRIYPTMDIEFPARLAVANGYFRSVDKVSKDNGKDLVPKDVRKSVQQAALNVQVTNGIPLQLSFRMNFVGLDTITSIRDTLFSIVPSAPILAAPVNNATGLTTGTTMSSFNVGLTNAQLNRLNGADSVAVRMDVMTANNGSQPYLFRSTDPVRVRVSGHIIYTINNK